MIRIDEQVHLKDHTPFQIGGPAAFFISISSENELKNALILARNRNLPVFFLGKGSNCLFDDRGYNGLVIKNDLNVIKIQEGSLEVGSGVFLPYLSMFCSERDLSGFEFAAGIPGSIGGALFMHASAHGQSISERLKTVKVMSHEGVVREIPKNEMTFGYRRSSFQDSKEMILSATFSLSKSTEVKDRVIKNMVQRKEKQPLGEKCLGSIFKNPSQTVSAGALIEKAGLKGVYIGGARISPKHANFIINENSATAQDVLWLIEKIQHSIREDQGIDLEKEIVVVPYE